MGFLVLLLLVVAALFVSNLTGSDTATSDATPSDDTTIRFAVIGDYGLAGKPEQDVADLVKGWKPDLIITTGDNNYSDNAAAKIDENIGQYYHDFMNPYRGRFGVGAPVNRFFPSLGNHDWGAEGAKPYLDYFTLPGNGRYYDFVRGPVHFFALDSDRKEPDGRKSDSTQGGWLRDQLHASRSCWKLVYFHHPPFSSGKKHGSTRAMRYPFKQWGADVVLSGHEHNYERIEVDGVLYFVNGAGGKSLYPFAQPISGSKIRYNGDYGAMLVEGSKGGLTFRFITRKGQIVDTVTLNKDCH